MELFAEVKGSRKLTKNDEAPQRTEMAREGTVFLVPCENGGCEGAKAIGKAMQPLPKPYQGREGTGITNHLTSGLLLGLPIGQTQLGAEECSLWR